MQDINININKARIQSIMVEFPDDDGLPQVTATIALLAGIKPVSTFSISTQGWRGQKFDLPAGMVPPILQLAQEMERVVTSQCYAALGQIEAPVVEVEDIPPEPPDRSVSIDQLSDEDAYGPAKDDPEDDEEPDNA
jgi:hypothetical protein